MKETLELRINYDYADLLFQKDEGKNIGTSVKIVELSKDDPRYYQIPIITSQIQKKYGKAFFFGWETKRKYSKKELESATLFHMKVKTTFEPAGEECGTLYDESTACEICGANRKQLGPLTLKRDSIPKKDITRTIAGEIVASEKFKKASKEKGMKGILLESLVFNKGVSSFSQLITSFQLELSKNTVVGINPFDLSFSSEGEIYKCPKGHTIGLNLLSEPYIINSPLIKNYDFFATKQLLGVKRGLLRPEPVYLCSSAFKRMIQEEQISGLEFEIANIE